MCPPALQQVWSPTDLSFSSYSPLQILSHTFLSGTAPHPLAPPSPPLPPVKVKWGKEKLELEVDPSEPVETLRMQLYSITGVPAERQKIMCKKHWKGTLKDTDE